MQIAARGRDVIQSRAMARVFVCFVQHFLQQTPFRGFALLSAKGTGQNWIILSQNWIVLIFDLTIVHVFPKHDKFSTNPVGNR